MKLWYCSAAEFEKGSTAELLLLYKIGTRAGASVARPSVFIGVSLNRPGGERSVMSLGLGRFRRKSAMTETSSEDGFEPNRGRPPPPLTFYVFCGRGMRDN